MAKVTVFSKVGHTSRSRSLGQKFWYTWKGLVTRNVHMKYKSPTSSGKEAMAKVKVFLKLGQTSRSRSLGKKVWYPRKGLVTRNTHVKYESSTYSSSWVIGKVKVFVHADAHTHADTDADARGYDNSSPYICPGKLKRTSTKITVAHQGHLENMLRLELGVWD